MQKLQIPNNKLHFCDAYETFCLRCENDTQTADYFFSFFFISVKSVSDKYLP